MKIAITQRVIDYRNGPYDSLDHGFYSMFKGHELLPIPNNLKFLRTTTITEADLVVFSGGNSMISENWQYNYDRLVVEKHVLDLAMAYEKKILGISRGTQFLTVSFGGNIKADPNHKKNHYVNSTGARVEVCSRHEEILGSIPVGAEVLAKDDDGNVEAWKLKDIGCVLWHPERMINHWMPDPLRWYK